jgi:hypothetical protein
MRQMIVCASLAALARQFVANAVAKEWVRPVAFSGMRRPYPS